MHSTNMRKQEPYDFLLRALIAIDEFWTKNNFNFRIEYEEKELCLIRRLPGLQMGTRQVTNDVKLASVLQTTRRQIRRKEEIYMQWTLGHSETSWQRNGRWIGISGLQERPVSAQSG